jgi:pyruvate/2-oxoglutarate dehydrogenase complex dihydrolipoamide dehydrogenase (E3) component
VLDHIPDHLLVLGGGYIELELAQAMRRFGSKVTVIDRNSRLAHSEDEDVSEALEQLCADEGIELLLGALVADVEGVSGDAITIRVVQSRTEKRLNGTDLLVATGRTPNTQGLGLESAGVDSTERGYIKVNEPLETTAPNVWAVGECAGSPQFAHIALTIFE